MKVPRFLSHRVTSPFTNLLSIVLSISKKNQTYPFVVSKLEPTSDDGLVRRHLAEVHLFTIVVHGDRVSRGAEDTRFPDTPGRRSESPPVQEWRAGRTARSTFALEQNLRPPADERRRAVNGDIVGDELAPAGHHRRIADGQHPLGDFGPPQSLRSIGEAATVLVPQNHHRPVQLPLAEGGAHAAARFDERRRVNCDLELSLNRRRVLTSHYGLARYLLNGPRAGGVTRGSRRLVADPRDAGVPVRFRQVTVLPQLAVVLVHLVHGVSSFLLFA